MLMEVIVFNSKQQKVIQLDEKQIITTCPVTKKKMVGKLWERQQFFGDYRADQHVLWWYCKTCKNWHALFVDEKPETTNQLENL